MKLNLNTIYYDTSEWKMIDAIRYRIRNLKTNEVYSFYDGVYYNTISIRQIRILGIYQISYDKFMVHCVLANTLHYICKFYLKHGDISQVFSISCKTFDILSDRTILFDNKFVLDIETNQKIEAFDWLEGQELVVLKKESHENPVIQAKFPIGFSPKCFNMEYVIAYVDTTTFTVIENTVFSTLRGKSIPITKAQTIQNIIEEDVVYFSKISDFFIAEDISAQKAFEQEIFG